MTQNPRFSIERGLLFFHQKYFLDPTRIFGKYKIKKKTPSKKWLGLHGFTHYNALKRNDV